MNIDPGRPSVHRHVCLKQTDFIPTTRLTSGCLTIEWWFHFNRGGEMKQLFLCLLSSPCVATDGKDEEIRLPRRTFLGTYRAPSAVKHPSWFILHPLCLMHEALTMLTTLTALTPSRFTRMLTRHGCSRPFQPSPAAAGTARLPRPPR